MNAYFVVNAQLCEVRKKIQMLVADILVKCSEADLKHADQYTNLRTPSNLEHYTCREDLLQPNQDRGVKQVLRGSHSLHLDRPLASRK